jgi:DNA polymerase III sliding clamp (beta) subunit (PCNA family)
MKLNVLRQDLLHALESAAKLGRRRDGNLYDGQVIFELAESRTVTRIQIVTRSRHNRSVTCVHSVLADLASTDEQTLGIIDPETLLQAIKSCESEVISIEVTPESVSRVEAGSFSTEIPGEPENARIAVDDVEPTHRVRIDVAPFREALQACNYTLGGEWDVSRTFIHDVFLRIGNDVIEALSTDGHRATHVPIYRADIPEGLQGFEVPIPRRLVSALLRYFERKRGKRGNGSTTSSGRVELLIDAEKKTVSLRHESESLSVYATFGLKDDKFPSFRKFLRGDYKHIFEVRCAPFIDALQALIKAAQWRSTEECKRGLDMTFVEGGLRLTIDQMKASCTSSTRVVRCGIGLKARINPKYLLEGVKALKEMGHATILMHVQDGYQPIFLTHDGADPLMERTFVVVMPMRLE